MPSNNPPSLDVSERLWTVADLAIYLAVSESAVYKMKYRGEIPFIQLGGSIRFSKADIDAALTLKKNGGSK